MTKTPQKHRRVDRKPTAKRPSMVEGGPQSQVVARQQNSFQGPPNKTIMFTGKARAH
jgi:hypothetical protein